MDKKTDVRDPDEKVVEIEMERLRAFPNHPFKVIGDSQMIELQDSIKKRFRKQEILQVTYKEIRGIQSIRIRILSILMKQRRD